MNHPEDISDPIWERPIFHVYQEEDVPYVDVPRDRCPTDGTPVTVDEISLCLL